MHDNAVTDCDAGLDPASIVRRGAQRLLTGCDGGPLLLAAGAIAEPLPPAMPLAELAGKLPVMPRPELPPSPPALPAANWALWLRRAPSDVPVLVPRTAPSPENPGCAIDPATLAGLPSGELVATGAVPSGALPVMGLPGEFALSCAVLPHPASTSAASNARPQAGAVIACSSWRSGGSHHQHGRSV